MKFSLSFLLLSFSFLLIAQSPNSFNFQGVARDMDGNPLPNKEIGLEFALIQGDPLGNIIYIESHQVTTQGTGLFSVQIGEGNVLNGDIATIDWSQGPYYLRTGLDEDGGQIYTIVGTSELLSVPYALYAANSGNQTWQENNLGIHYDGKVGINNESPQSRLHVSEGDVYIDQINKGVIMKSPNGTCWRMTVSNLGQSVWTQMSCPGEINLTNSVSFDPPSLTFALLENSKSFTILNDGEVDYSWTLSYMAAELNVSPNSGFLSAGQSIEITVDIDRSGLETNIFEYELNFESDSQLEIAIPVTVDNFKEEKLLLQGTVVDASIDNLTDNIIAVYEQPNKLEIINTSTQEITSMDLVKRPTCISISPDGQHASVGHDGGFSYIDLNTQQLVRYYNVTTEASDIIDAGSGWVYVMPRTDQWERLRCINLESGVESESTGNSIRANTTMKLHPSGDYIYGADNGLSPSDFEKYDIRNGVASYLYDSPYHGDFSFGGDIWIAEDGIRLFAGSRNVFLSSENQETDMTYNGKLDGEYSISTLDHSSASGRIATVFYGGNTWNGFPSNIVSIFEDEFLNLESEKTIPPFLVPDGMGSGTVYQSQGEIGMFNQSGTQFYLFVKAEQGSGLLNNWALTTIAID